MTRKELLDQALEAVGGSTTELAQRLGIDNTQTASTFFKRFPQGKAISYDRTIALLEIAGLFREAEAQPAASDEVSPDPVAAAEALFSRLEKSLRNSVDDLGLLRGLLPPERGDGEQPQTPPPAQQPPAAEQ